MVHSVVPMQIPAKKNRKWLYSLAAVAACLVLFLTAVLPMTGQPYASVYVKINPEVRIDVDKNDRVVGLEGVNADGIALIEGYDFHKKDLELVADELVDLAIAAGFLQANGQITLTLDSADQIWVTDHSQTLSDHMYKHLQDRFTVTISVSLHHAEHNDSHHTAPATEAPTDSETEPVTQQTQPTAPAAPEETEAPIVSPYEDDDDRDDPEEDDRDDLKDDEEDDDYDDDDDHDDHEDHHDDEEDDD